MQKDRVIKENNVYFDIFDNAKDYLEKSLFFIEKSIEDPKYWKWAAISLHGALYGFLIAALEVPDSPGAINSTKKGNRLIGFDTALKRLQKPDYNRVYDFIKPLELTKKQLDSIKIVKNRLRDPFIHFLPQPWIIDFSGIANIAADVIAVIKHLMTSDYIFLSSNRKIKNVRHLCNRGLRILKSHPLYMASDI
ncbi:MAG: hypothetical protein NT002_01160 [candidate division Zixibacteria bacterium]|nr:hypothetical protein [candidate division Zixibacteria bacterium]